MGCLEYVSMETEDSTAVKECNADRPKLLAVRDIGIRNSDQVARRVAEVLDFELAQGSMPT